MWKHFLKAALLLITCLFSVPVLAKTIELEPITVIGNRSSRPSFDTEPVSKTDFYHRELIERGINNLENLSQQIPNLHLINEGIGSFGQQFSLRGLSNTALFGAPVVVYTDDVPYSSSMAMIGNLFTID